jgi:hypothetical protein
MLEYIIMRISDLWSICLLFWSRQTIYGRLLHAYIVGTKIDSLTVEQTVVYNA